MIKKVLLILLLFISLIFNGQSITKSHGQFPIFPSCQDAKDLDLEQCFYKELYDFIFANYKIPEKLNKNNYSGEIVVLFEVDQNGTFKVLFADSNEPDLVEEIRRVFALFPKIAPPIYNGRPTYSKFTVTIPIPLKSYNDIESGKIEKKDKKLGNDVSMYKKELKELDEVKSNKFSQPQFKSKINIPFSHSVYAQFDQNLNIIGSNNHTGSKPYSYAEVSKYYDFKDAQQKLLKKTSDWWGRKLWNENLVEFQGEDYWFTFNPIIDLQAGISNPNAVKTYVNTRAIQLQGGLGDQLTFSTTIYESQGDFAPYFNRYAESIKPAGGNPAVIPGIGIAKPFNDSAYDFPMAEANLTFTANKFVDVQMGYGRNFIGDGYRSLILSDGSSPYPYVKLNTTFWKFKYTNTYMWLKDIRPEATLDKTYATKYIANHYLSWNMSKRFNLGLFESVVWGDTNNRGFDMNFVNPIIFYRTVEFTSSSRSGNALLGTTAKYKLSNSANLYGQFLLDEFSVGDVKAQNYSWKNKYGYQIGLKYYNAFKVKNLLIQAELNNVRPYVYSHSDPLTNYASNNQSIGHQWGGNFKEFVVITRYFKGRYFADFKLTYGYKGLDFDTPDNNYNYGGNIFKNYEDNKPYFNGVKVGQGNKVDIFMTDVKLGYLVNPATNLKFYASLIYRNFNPMTETATVFKEETTWFSLGIRSDVFNWYFDY